MSFSFNCRQGLIIVQAELEGPSGSAVLRFALDTGATATVINVGMLVSIGYDPALTPDRFQITTGSGVEFVPRITISKIVSLGQERLGFPVLCHTLPPSAGIDGLLGLDFFRGQYLTIDFQNGQINLS
jgi:predicted aspartyl protease